MAIQDGDIKFLASQVLADVPEGGGAATGVQIVDGAMNNLFPKISDLDRVYGNLSLRKLFVGVQTPDTESYRGVYVIVLKRPADPGVSMVLFSTEDSFDLRADAASRVEAYLAVGSAFAGMLFGNHLAGMSTMTLLLRESVELPVVGSTLVLAKLIDQPGQFMQFVRVKDVSSRLRTFADGDGEFKRVECVLELTDSLRQAFPGFDAVRQDASINYTGRTKVFDVMVADAARYYGIVPLAAPAKLGDFVVKAEGIFTQLVPSNQVETPIADARMNQQLAMVVPGGDDKISGTIGSAVLNANTAIYLGGSILPGSLVVTFSPGTLIDDGGLLVDKSTMKAVGVVDYENGVLTSTAGTVLDGRTASFTWQPAVPVVVPTNSIGFDVTIESQRLTWVFSMNPVPGLGTLQVSYRSGGRWYVLQDKGSGALKGNDAKVGAGSLNRQTGTVSLTLGALPDVGSKIIATWGDAHVSPPVLPEVLSPFDTTKTRVASDFRISLEGVQPGSVAVRWGGTTVKEDGEGRLGSRPELGSDWATGLVDYAGGRVVIVWRYLPPPNTSVTISYRPIPLFVPGQQEISVLMQDLGAQYGIALEGPIKPRTLKISVWVRYLGRRFPGVDAPEVQVLQLQDDGVGKLVSLDGSCGTVDYATGAVRINKTYSGRTSHANWISVRLDPGSPLTYFRPAPTPLVRQQVITVLNGHPDAGSSSASGFGLSRYPTWMTATSPPITQNDAYGAVFCAPDPAERPAESRIFAVGKVYFSVDAGAPNKLGSRIEFWFQGQRHVGLIDGVLYRSVNTSTGRGTPVGTVDFDAGRIELTNWSAATMADVEITKFVGISEPPPRSPDPLALLHTAVFRTAVAPLRNGSFSLVMTVAGWAAGDEQLIVAAGADGVLRSGGPPLPDGNAGSAGIFGHVDYDSGVVEFWVGRRVPDAYSGEMAVNVEHLKLEGVKLIVPAGVYADSVRYNASAFSYLPLDADILGIDPVRLPNDGRVPVFRSGTVAVVHHAASTLAAVVSNGQTLNTGRTRLYRARAIGADGRAILAGYTADLDAGTVTFTDVAGMSQPVHVEHLIQDTALVADAQIGGQLRFTRPLTHDFPMGSCVSSALLIGDMQSRVSALFDQQTWQSTWSDVVSGTPASATYDAINNPVAVTNDGAVTERWALVFSGSTTFSIVGEHLGLIGTGNVAADCQPLNPNTGHPYFTLKAPGWGSGWAPGNALRLNTIGSIAPIWGARVTQQGIVSVREDGTQLLVLGSV